MMLAAVWTRRGRNRRVVGFWRVGRVILPVALRIVILKGKKGPRAESRN